ncbi:MAG: cytochrome c biogenesis CcdA family protein [Wenzhouxiangella sp.]
MTLELTAIPLAAFAGALSILSPCVWPLVPAVMSSAATSGRLGPWMLGLGLSLSFAAGGTVLTFLLLNLGLDTDLLRYVAAALLLLIALVLLVDQFGAWVNYRLSLIMSSVRLPEGSGSGASGQFGVGLLLGLVWLPCVGPTLGAAIALASIGESMSMAFVVMFAFGIGCALVLLAAGFASTGVLNRVRPGVLARARQGKKLLGWTLLLLAVLVLTGVDKVLETWALQVLPDWAISI